jgi:hypothetical protein
VATARATVRVRYARGTVTRDVAPGRAGMRIRDASEIEIYTPLLSVMRSEVLGESPPKSGNLIVLQHQ